MDAAAGGLKLLPDIQSLQSSSESHCTMFQTYPAQGMQLPRAQQMQSLWAEHKNQ